MSIEWAPFQDDFIADAAALLAARHRRDRLDLPELPPRFEDPLAARKAVEAVWRRPGSSGVGAIKDGRLLGYLIGDVNIDTLRGRTAWIHLAGHALDQRMDTDLYRDLYAAAAPGWLAHGCFDHYTMVPAADNAALAAWFALSFGQEQAHALSTLNPAADDSDIAPRGITLRRANSDDRASLRDMSSLIARYQAQAPTWGVALPEDMSALREGYAGLVDDPTVIVWLALRGSQPLGFQAYFATQATDDDMLTPESCIELKVAGTRPEDRGHGIGRALTRRGLADARAHGYAFCLTDWRVTNLLSSRFWPRQGFRPVAYRLTRKVDRRVIWANGLPQ
jgi:ribosomal protein S18 acetylase RimI-like enzyme